MRSIRLKTNIGPMDLTKQLLHIARLPTAPFLFAAAWGYHMFWPITDSLLSFCGLLAAT